MGPQDRNAVPGQPPSQPPSDETVDEYLQRWLTIEDTLPLEEKTKRDYRQMAAHPIRELGTKPLKSLTVLDIQQFYAKLSEQKKSRRTINFVHTVLKMALKDAVEWGLLIKNPADKAKAPLGRREKPLRIPTPEEMHQLLEATRDARWYPLWFWFATTGTRLGEALALRWGDIDWEKGQVTIRRALSGDGAHRVIKTPKSASGMRTFSVGPKIQATLRQLQEDQAIWGEQAGSAWNDEDYVFTTYQGKLLSKRNIDRAFKQALEQAGLPSDIRIHDLRHGMATQWLSGGRVRRWSANAWVIPTLALPCKFMGMCCPMTKYRPPMQWRISWSMGRKTHQHFINTKFEKRAYRRIRQSHEPSQKWRNDTDFWHFGIRQITVETAD